VHKGACFGFCPDNPLCQYHPKRLKFFSNILYVNNTIYDSIGSSLKGRFCGGNCLKRPKIGKFCIQIIRLVKLYGRVRLRSVGTHRICLITAYYRNCHTVLYRNYGKIRYGVRYGAKLALPVQKWPQKGLSAPNTSHFRSPMYSSHVLTPHNAA
jgi:hypothetical protein